MTSGKTAGKTATRGAKPSKKTSPRWHMVTRNGKTRLVAPNGERFTGTPQEVRAAALTPNKRDDLAGSLRLARYLRSCRTVDATGYMEMCNNSRMNAILSSMLGEKLPQTLTIPQDKYILLVAGSRLVRGNDRSFQDFINDSLQCELEALLDQAEAQTGKREIPLTRQERLALARLNK